MCLITKQYCPHQFMNIRICCPAFVFTLPMFFAKIPCRLIVVMMVYSAVAVHMMMRANISVIIVDMVPTGNNIVLDTNSLNWNAYQRSNVMVSCYWGEFISCIFGGPIVERWGPRKVLTISTILTSLLTALCVPAAKLDYIAILVVRITLGLCSGVMLPTLHFLISRWAVPMEKGKFVGAIALGTMGIFFSWTICGYVIKYFGWEWAFYVFTIIGLVWTAIWLYVVYDSPHLHPRISPSEKNYIYNYIEIQDKPKKQQHPKPYGRILTSIPVWSLGLLNFGAGWGTFFVITVAPNYISKALGLNVTSTGFLSGSIYLSKAICAMIFSIIGDMLLERRVVSLPVLRKVATIISHILPGFGLLLLLKSGEDPSYYICVMIISMSFYGASALNVYANGHDLTKNFVGTVNGFANSFITAAGIVSPLLTALFTQEEEYNPAVWKPVFYLGSSIFILTGLQFLMLVSTNKQTWDAVPNETVEEKNASI